MQKFLRNIHKNVRLGTLRAGQLSTAIQYFRGRRRQKTTFSKNVHSWTLPFFFFSFLHLGRWHFIFCRPRKHSAIHMNYLCILVLAVKNDREIAQVCDFIVHSQQLHRYNSILYLNLLSCFIYLFFHFLFGDGPSISNYY